MSRFKECVKLVNARNRMNNDLRTLFKKVCNLKNLCKSLNLSILLLTDKQQLNFGVVMRENHMIF